MTTLADRVDRRWMREALRLASRGEGFTRPNPPVGAVVVRQGKVIGRGWHQKAGGPHAEVFALAEAGKSARGATLYVTLEPCSTWGRTPPCTEAIIRAGIRRVVAGAGDPNPRHASRGFELLKKAGIAAVRGVLESECLRLIEPFRKWIQSGAPFLTLKLGMTADGRIADASGASRWITGPESRKRVQALRRRADAILVGAQTVCADNPSLLPKGEAPNPVYRVIIDGAGRVPPDSTVLTDARAAQTIVVTAAGCPASRQRAWTKHGGTVWPIPARQGRVSLAAVMKRLGKLGLMHVVCEGGGALAEALVREGLVDEYWLFYAPRLLGGKAVPGFGGAGWTLAGAPELTFESVTRSGQDLLVKARPGVRKEPPCSRD
jgi:diaminohydroxyphosphoribosylaminopyrimidine deaminase/5-amino-6-(5-phosphoribosylamino)uracil reductase